MFDDVWWLLHAVTILKPTKCHHSSLIQHPNSHVLGKQNWYPIAPACNTTSQPLDSHLFCRFHIPIPITWFRKTPRLKCQSGWWLTYPSEKHARQLGLFFLTEWKVIKFHGSTRNQPAIYPMKSLQDGSSIPWLKCQCFMRKSWWIPYLSYRKIAGCHTPQDIPGALHQYRSSKANSSAQSPEDIRPSRSEP